MEDDIKELCERADYYGMEALTEQEQYIIMHKDKYEGEVDKDGRE